MNYNFNKIKLKKQVKADAVALARHFAVPFVIDGDMQTEYARLRQDAINTGARVTLPVARILRDPVFCACDMGERYHDGNLCDMEVLRERDLCDWCENGHEEL